MAALDINRAGAFAPASRLSAAFAIVAQAYADWRLRRATIEQLSQLSDRALEDIGIERANIAARAR